ncbi:caleosin domain-containing protein [Dothidotthia symphoricarpi CBS 119687]|uniref:Caleosin domain-containing protein n=1 Tax=Dothidotthia symphoricarpi CBS 119687 TaxID=1392245 RepID=A0A6A6ADW1_9PLEO|nr:caleosin domain-containing protein [Dothidotthia symphoricarpi CBS 119687]KAF2129285.1 caleosin domain-containing protein [Dothidotthia symphoricarpi CBS 119687]
MTIELNILSARVTFEFGGKKPAKDEIKSGKDCGYENRKHAPPGLASASDETLVDEEDTFNQQETITWIAGVGDVCHSAILNTTPSTHQRPTKHLPPLSEKAPRTSPSKPPPLTHHTTLQRHCAFWAPPNTSLIYPWHIYTGFQRLGFNALLCLWAALTLPLCASYNTQSTWIPHPLFAINIDNMAANRHGSSTGTYDMNGELDERRFEAVFEKYARGGEYLTGRDIWRVWKDRRCANDFFGWFAGGLEWVAMYILLWPEDGKMSKADVRGVYDGSVFYRIAERRSGGTRT